MGTQQLGHEDQQRQHHHGGEDENDRFSAVQRRQEIFREHVRTPRRGTTSNASPADLEEGSQPIYETPRHRPSQPSTTGAPTSRKRQRRGVVVRSVADASGS